MTIYIYSHICIWYFCNAFWYCVDGLLFHLFYLSPLMNLLPYSYSRPSPLIESPQYCSKLQILVHFAFKFIPKFPLPTNPLYSTLVPSLHTEAWITLCLVTNYPFSSTVTVTHIHLIFERRSRFHLQQESVTEPGIIKRVG